MIANKKAAVYACNKLYYLKAGLFPHEIELFPKN
jgi:hypothetical protein